MKKLALYIGFFLLFAPQITTAQTISCSDIGYTVVFVNGVLDTLDKAKYEKDQLRFKFGDQYNNQPVNFLLGYNETHLAGVGDLAQSLAQEFSYSVSDYDLHTILMQIYPEITTRKLLLVGHSQGAYYTSELYNYLLAHGEPKEALAVYDVGTPAPKVAGGGKYLNSSSDLLLTYLHDTLHFGLMPSNIDIPLTVSDLAAVWPGHSFTNAYLAGAPERIVSDISSELSALAPTYSTNTGGCFTPPDSTIGYKTQRAIFLVADPTAAVIKTGAIAGVSGVVAIGNIVLNGVTTAFNFLSNALPGVSINITNGPSTEKNFTVLKTLYGSSLDTPDVKELLKGQGSAVALAINGGFVEGTSTGPVASSSPSSSTPTSSPVYVPAPSTWVPTGSSPTVETPPVAQDSASSTPDTATSTQEATSTEPVPPIVDDSATTTPDIATSTEEATSTETTSPVATTSPAFFCDPYTVPFIEGQAYVPNEGGMCNFTVSLDPDKFIKQMEIYKGVTGSSTLLTSRIAIGDLVQTFWVANVSFKSPQPGDQFFVVAYSDTDGSNLGAYENYLQTGQGVPPPDLELFSWYWGTTQ